MECRYCMTIIEEDQLDSWCYTILPDERVDYAHWRCLLLAELEYREL